MRLLRLGKRFGIALTFLGIGLLAGIVTGQLTDWGEFAKRTDPFRGVHEALFAPKHRYLSHHEVGDGERADRIILQDPVGVGEDGEGRVYVTDRGRYVWRIDPDGHGYVVAGAEDFTPAPSVAARPGRQTSLRSPEGLCVDQDGQVYFADSVHHMVMRLEPNGDLTRIAGKGVAGFSGDGDRATIAMLNEPFDVTLDSKGRIYIADFRNHRIRRVDESGIITTIAGTGEPGYDGDGGPATAAALHGPYGVFVDARDNLYISDSLNHVIRKVTPTGTISTVAGIGGRRGYGGDGKLAIDATFDTPQDLFVDNAGQVWIDDEHNHCIRVVRSDGIIQTVVGTGEPGDCNTPIPQGQARLNDPEGVWVRRDGTLLITDGDNGKVRVVSSAGMMETLAGRPSNTLRR